MSQAIQLEIEVPDELKRCQLLAGVQHRLHELLNKQDGGTALTAEERSEAEGLVDLADWLALLRLRTQRLSTSA